MLTETKQKLTRWDFRFCETRVLWRRPITAAASTQQVVLWTIGRALVRI